MINIAPIKSGLESRISDIERDEKRSVGQLSRAKDKAVNAITKDHDQKIDRRKREFATQKASEKEEYFRRAGGELVRDLDESYELLQGRSDIPQVDEDAQANIKRRLDALSVINKDIDLSDSLQRQAAFVISQFTEDEIRIAEQILDGKVLVGTTIDSYIAAGNVNGQNQIYVVLPINECKNKELATSLEKKAYIIMDQEEITIGATVTSRGRKDAYMGSASARKIAFSFDFNQVNGFLTYTITPTNPIDDPDVLAKELAEKFGELQPANFEKAKVSHKMNIIDFDVLKYFMENSRNDLYSLDEKLEELKKRRTSVSDKEAAQLLGRPLQGLRSMATRTDNPIERAENGEILVESMVSYANKRRGTSGMPDRRTSGERRVPSTPTENPHAYQATTQETIKQEALARLSQYAGQEMIGSVEIANVLGIKNATSVGYIMRKLPNVDRSKKRHTVPVKEIRKYIQGREYTQRGWIDVEEVRESARVALAARHPRSS